MDRGPALRRCLHNPRRVAVISLVRGRRPQYGASRAEAGSGAFCPFCPGNEEHTPPAVLVLAGPGVEGYRFTREERSGEAGDWVVRVFPNKYPALSPEPGSELVYGYHEVLVESRIHSEEEYLGNPENVFLAFRTLRERLRQILRDPEIRHVAVIKNSGVRAGASIPHPHLQIFASPFLPPEIEDEICGFREYEEKTGVCPLCRLASSGSLVFYRNGSFASLVAYAPRVPYETLVVPLRHTPSFLDADDGELLDLGNALSRTLLALRRVLGGFDYNLWLHSVYDARLESYHWHVEILPLTTRWGGYEKGFGVFIVDRFPEDVASELRGAISSGK